MTEYLCVGGPLAGQRYQSTHEWFVTRPQQKGLTKIDDPIQDTTVTHKHVRYVKEAFRAAETLIIVWVPEGQSPAQTLELLLSTYEKFARVI